MLVDWGAGMDVMGFSYGGVMRERVGEWLDCVLQRVRGVLREFILGLEGLEGRIKVDARVDRVIGREWWCGGRGGGRGFPCSLFLYPMAVASVLSWICFDKNSGRIYECLCMRTASVWHRCGD